MRNTSDLSVPFIVYLVGNPAPKPRISEKEQMEAYRSSRETIGPFPFVTTATLSSISKANLVSGLVWIEHGNWRFASMN